MKQALLNNQEILSLIQKTKQNSTTYTTIRGIEFGCEWVEANDSGDSELWYVYREDNWNEFAYAVDFGSDYFNVEIGEWLEAAE
jgi:hypothetical protein